MLNIEGVPYMAYTGCGGANCKNFTYDLEVGNDVLKLTIGYEDWGCEGLELVKMSEATVTLENHDGKWQLTCDPLSGFGILFFPDEYTGLYGASAVE